MTKKKSTADSNKDVRERKEELAAGEPRDKVDLSKQEKLKNSRDSHCVNSPHLNDAGNVIMQNQDTKSSEDSILPSSGSGGSDTSNQKITSLNTGSDYKTQSDLGKVTGFEVFLRIRPLEDGDADTGSARLRSLSVQSDNEVLLCTRPSKGKEKNGSKYHFTFARIFQESTPQKDVFQVTTQAVVEAVLNGHHACVMTYGIPNSGKSYTLYGKATSGKHRGVIIRAMEYMLNEIQQNENEETVYRVSTFFLQIYNEKFHDLLDPSASEGIRIHENGDRSLINGATKVVIKTVDDVSKQLRKSPNRFRDAGRSHTIFTVQVRKEERIKLPNTNEESTDLIKVTEGELRFVDLVGVERSTKHVSYDSPAKGSADSKAARSLQLLANALVFSGDDKESLVPYRDSKLTRLLRNALGGDCITRLILTATPCPNRAHETLSCLQIAQKACQIKNQPLPRIHTEERPKSGEVTEEPSNSDIVTTSSGMTSSSSDKLPPIRPQYPITSHVSHGDGDAKPPVGAEGFANPPLHGDNPTSTESVVALSAERSHKGTNATSLPAVSGQVVTQQSSSTYRQLQALQRTSPKWQRIDQQQQQTHRKKSFERDNQQQPTPPVAETNFSSSIQPAAEYLINGAVACPYPATGRRYSVTKSSKNRRSPEGNLPPTPQSTTKHGGAPSTERTRDCCENCHAREEKIKGDYDRMIVFQNRVRDDKQAQLEGALLELRKLKTELPIKLRLLEEELSSKRATIEIYVTENNRLESVIKSLKEKMSGMISNVEHAELQNMRKKEAEEKERLKSEFENVKRTMELEACELNKELQRRSDVIKKMERKTEQLRKESQDKVQGASQLQVADEAQIQAKQDNAALQSRELPTRNKETRRLGDNDGRMKNLWEEEKKNFERELALAKQKASTLQAELKIAEGKLLSRERELSSRCARARRKEEMENSDSSTTKTDGICVKCGVQRKDDGTVTTQAQRDEEFRLLMERDEQNQAALVQLKRERNLLCDVMKIMYCRRWFTEDASYHVKRTLRRVGIDTKSLSLLKKNV